MYLIYFRKADDTLGYISIGLRGLGILLPLLYCFPLGLSNLYFFVKRKYERDGLLSYGTTMILFWVFFLWLAKLVHGLCQSIIVSMQFLLNTDRRNLWSPTINYIFLLTIMPFAYIVDFLIIVTLLYLFYCQGKSAEEREKRATTGAQ